MTSLFLHWGPGGNAEIERRWFKNDDSVPGSSGLIDWWNQPLVSGENAFEDLVAAAASRLDENYRDANGPIHLIAHSFGGIIARSLLKVAPEKISGLTLLACGNDPWKAFINLAHSLSDAGLASGQALKNAAQKADQSRRFSDFMELIGQIVQVPGFQDHYWGNLDARSRYKSLSQGVELLDFQCFEAVMKKFDRMAPDTQSICLREGFRTRCFLGARDPLQVTNEESQAWSQVFPGCQVRIDPSAGHFVHFETDSSIWLR